MENFSRWWAAWSEEHPGCVVALLAFMVCWFMGWLLLLLVFLKILTTDFSP